MDETLIIKHMKNLDISREEAIQLINDDKEIDRMKDREVNSDLSADQQAIVKKAKQADRKPTQYNFQQRERKANVTKIGLVQALCRFLSENTEIVINDCRIVNPDRQIAFTLGGDSYDLTLVKHNKKKG